MTKHLRTRNRTTPSFPQLGRDALSCVRGGDAGALDPEWKYVPIRR